MTTLRLDLSRTVRREIDGELVIVGGDGTDFMATNETGALLWSRLESGATLDELVEAITDEYDVTAEVARGDVEEFVEELRTRGLLLQG